jgi:exodeoxyribonuclease-1
MQFAGQRTDMNLKPVGEPFNILIKMTDDVLPQPEACLITGITPQKTIAEGISEAEFVKIFDQKINKPGSIFTGFNSVRFDDEFMRFLFYRNYFDPYQWQWQDGRSRWDLLDLSRMARALRPQGIKWPTDDAGKPTNRLELLASANKLDHDDAHDALSDVRATIALAKLLKDNNPKLFDYLLNMRDKKKVKQLCLAGRPLVYTSGKYDNEFAKTAVVYPLGLHPEKNGALVYDLRADPKKYIDLKPEKLAELWKYDKEKKKVQLPIKAMQFNRCPAVAPLGVLDEDSKKRLSVDDAAIAKNLKILTEAKDFYQNVAKAASLLNQARQQQSALLEDETDVEERLYNKFIPDPDRHVSDKIRWAEPGNIMDFKSQLSDGRLKKILPLYKARNYKKSLSADEHLQWEGYRKNKLLSGGEDSRFAKFGQKLESLAASVKSDEKKYVLEELKLYGLGIRPED